MSELKIYVVTASHRDGWKRKGKWKWFNDLSHAKNYAHKLRMDGVEVEMFDERKAEIDI